jgi:hypothetical protein
MFCANVRTIMMLRKLIYVAHAQYPARLTLTGADAAEAMHPLALTDGGVVEVIKS